MTSIILASLLIIGGIILGYGHIRLAITKEKENELLKRKIQADLDAKRNELNHYKSAIRIMEGWVNKPEGKRMGFDDLDDKVVAILSRCGFFLNTINDNEYHKDKKELKFRLSGKDLLEVVNRNIN